MVENWTQLDRNLATCPRTAIYNIPDESLSYENAARGSGEQNVTTKEMAGWKLSHEEMAGKEVLENLYGVVPYISSLPRVLMLVPSRLFVA